MPMPSAMCKSQVKMNTFAIRDARFHNVILLRSRRRNRLSNEIHDDHRLINLLLFWPVITTTSQTRSIFFLTIFIYRILSTRISFLMLCFSKANKLPDFPVFIYIIGCNEIKVKWCAGNIFSAPSHATPMDINFSFEMVNNCYLLAFAAPVACVVYGGLS